MRLFGFVFSIVMGPVCFETQYMKAKCTCSADMANGD